MDYTILPADKYKVINKTILTNDDKNNLLCFYEPIIGPIAVSLYLLLWQDLECNLESSELTHFHLMNLLKVKENTLKEARESLEAVGLLRSFVKKENVLNYIYELYSPLKANDILNHPILGVVLYSNIGAEEFLKLVNKYQKKKYDLSSYEEITKKMDEVYKVSSMDINADIQEVENENIKLDSKIDYNLIIESIPKEVFSEKALNKKTKELIDNLSFIYNIDTIKMIEYIRKSLNEYGMIDKNTLREVAGKYYSLSSGRMPTIVYRKQPFYLKKPEGDNSVHGKVVAMFDNVSPYDFLKAKNKGTAPTARDLKLVEYLLLDQELTPAVVNVLLDYCLRKNNNKLVGAYVQTVAGQWKRAGLKTAEEAMLFAEKEHKKMSKKQKEENNIIPSWFNKDIKKEEVSSEEQAELDELLKEFK